ncbi:1-phosphofructokinase [Atopobacter phocae]|uniref:1-phosphofructokinase n=1 Tax=Atopobacter phocae TaxID=136492 RepID=UPI001FE0D81A|nr:1-phosphofructokinase [Atopobacter phocae]
MMIYTVTLNPAVDVVLQVEQFEPGTLNRTKKDDYVAGGKGINASIILQRLGHTNVATGFLGGFTGALIESVLVSEGVMTNFIPIDGTTRINVKLKATEETEINALGPTISSESFEQLIAYLTNQLVASDYVFLAGNNAPGLTAEHYVQIAQVCQKVGAHLVLDTNQKLLVACLPYQPFIIKPNHHELGEIFNVTLTNESDILRYAKELQQMGARHVLVSRGGDGALLLTEDGRVYHSNVPDGEVVNSVGAGDSMLAGFVSAYMETSDPLYSLKRGAATGSATAYSVGIATREKIEALLPMIQVEER